MGTRTGFDSAASEVTGRDRSPPAAVESDAGETPEGLPVRQDGGDAVVDAARGATPADDDSLSERARADAELLRLIELATDDVLWDWDLTTDRIRWNGAVARRFRYRPDELRASLEWHVERIHPDDRERVMHGVERAILGVGCSWSDEYRLLRGDGTYAAVFDRAHVVRNGRGEPIRVVGWMVDISERAASEEAQRFLARATAALDEPLDVAGKADALARLVVPQLADCCLVDLCEPDGSLRRAAAVHVDAEREEVLARDAVFTRDEAQELAPAAVLRTAVADFVSADPVSACARLGIGGRAGVRAFLSLPVTARGRVLGALTLAFSDPRRHCGPLDLMTANDLAHRAGLALDNAYLYETALRAVQVRNELIGVVSHDLRVPVNTILATLALLSDTMRDRRQDVWKWFNILSRSTEQMKALIEDLLDASRMESQHFSVNPANESASDIISQACEMLEPLAAARDISIVRDIQDALPPVSVDGPQIVRVITNLVANAIKFSPRGARISVRACTTEREVQVSVRDEGEGIRKEQLVHVFDRFWTGRPGDRRGAGLGLTIAKGIVEAHGGRIWAESDDGRGSTFTFALPVAGAPRSGGESAGAAESATGDAQPTAPEQPMV